MEISPCQCQCQCQSNVNGNVTSQLKCQFKRQFKMQVPINPNQSTFVFALELAAATTSSRGSHRPFSPRDGAFERCGRDSETPPAQTFRGRQKCRGVASFSVSQSCVGHCVPFVCSMGNGHLTDIVVLCIVHCLLLGCGFDPCSQTQPSREGALKTLSSIPGPYLLKCCVCVCVVNVPIPMGANKTSNTQSNAIFLSITLFSSNAVLFRHWRQGCWPTA